MAPIFLLDEVVKMIYRLRNEHVSATFKALKSGFIEVYFNGDRVMRKCICTNGRVLLSSVSLNDLITFDNTVDGFVSACQSWWLDYTSSKKIV